MIEGDGLKPYLIQIQLMPEPQFCEIVGKKMARNIRKTAVGADRWGWLPSTVILFCPLVSSVVVSLQATSPLSVHAR